jgi:uncharacterized protein (TIGR02001 family)
MMAALALYPAAASAQPADGAELSAATGLQISGSVSLVSDYRFRGISQTDIAPAIQPALQLDHASGFFVGFWGSNVADFNGATTEIDLSAGWSGIVAGLDTSFGVLGYLYPGGSGTDVAELFGTFSLPVGPLVASLGLNWAPEQANSGASRYAYAAVSAAIPGTPLTLSGSIGHERGGFVSDDTGRTTAKWDWMLGASASWSTLTLGLAYLGTDLPTRDTGGARANRAGRDALVLTLFAAF